MMLLFCDSGIILFFIWKYTILYDGMLKLKNH